MKKKYGGNYSYQEPGKNANGKKSIKFVDSTQNAMRRLKIFYSRLVFTTVGILCSSNIGLY